MKNFRSAIGISFFFAHLFLTIPTRAAGSWQVKFYCAPGSGNKMPPTTYVKTSSKKELALVTWESAPKKMTNQQRCNNASQRFQTAWDKGSLDKIVAGKDNEGSGIICGLSYRENKCDRSNTLFTLSRYSDAQDIMDKLKSNMIAGTGNSSPIYQGSGRNSVDFKQFIQKAAASNN
jgi:hypothetical protein